MFKTLALVGALALACMAASLPVDAIAQVAAAATTNIVAPAGSTAAVPQADGSIVFVRPLIDGLQPFIISTLGAIIVACGGWLIAIFQKKDKYSNLPGAA